MSRRLDPFNRWRTKQQHSLQHNFSSSRSRWTEVSPLGDVIRAWIDYHRLGKDFDRQAVLATWRSMAGSTIANHTTQCYIRGKVLYLQIDHDGLRHHLSMRRDYIIEQLSEKLGKEVITDIKLF